MITILRLGHRVVRDQRITTHVALTSRAFGADRIVISGEKDEGIIDGIRKVCKEFGGNFEAEFTDDWEEFTESWKKKNKKGAIVHLTMYGVDISSVAKKLAAKAKRANMLIVVGGPKVPTEMYKLADYNVAVGSQPHSEVAAIAIVLDRILGEKSREFNGWRIKVIPNQRGKTVLQKGL